ncbi:MAG: Flp pilus assembly protein CpaB [Sandarakinorhabdus sp.]|nr:Flp pilus assembly protein CpaB [Sandarakinorhabdus sp.]
MQRTLVRLILSSTLAVGTLVATQSWVESRTAAATTADSTTVEVLVTAHEVEAGASLKAGDLRWQAWPARAISPGWQVRGRRPASMVGRVIPMRLDAGVPVTDAMSIAAGNGSGFAAAIRPGWRAATIAVTPAAGLAGFVAPGDRVDVLLVQTLGNRRTAQTLLDDLGVLGVDQRQRADLTIAAPLAAASDVVADATKASGSAPPDLVTLEVTPRQAEALAIAAELGKLSLVLRGPGREVVAPGGRRWDSDVTGLSPALLASSVAGGGLAAALAPEPVQAPAFAPAVPPVSAPPAEHGGVEVSYGLPAAASSAPEAKK